MGDPGASTQPGSLENFAEDYNFSEDLNSTSWNFNDYIDYNDDTTSEASVRADESRADPSSGQNDQYVNDLSPVCLQGIFDELEESQADGLCKRTTSDGKCNCPVCSKKSFDKDLRELVNFDIPDAPHVFAFHMPPDGISGQLDSNSFSNDMSLLQPPPGSSHNRLRPINRELCRNKSGKRGRLGEKSPDANVMALMKEVLQSGGTLSPELLIRIQHSVDKGERSHHPNSTMLSSRRQETGFASPSFSPNPFMSMRHPTSESSSHRQGARVASSSYYSAAPFMDAGGARNELQPRHQETGLASSSANSTPFMGVGRSMNENIPSDFNLFTTSQSQSASSVSSILSSRSHDSKTTNNTLVGSRRTRQSNFTLYQCTFKLCDKTFPSKSDWKRHEESVHKQRYMCMECGTGLADPRGGYACGLCWAGPFASLDAVKIHTIQCEEAQKVGKSFARKDKLRNHLREDHGQLIFSEDAFSWVYDVDSDWPRECGFCGDPLNDWDLRANHIELHFIDGERISTWTIPFPRSRDVKQQWPGNDPGDDDEDDDDDHDYGFDDSKGSGGIRVFSQSYGGAESTNYQATSSTVMWNYRTHAQEPVQDLDAVDPSVWESENEDNESESTYTQTVVQVPVNSSKLLEIPRGPKTSTGVVAHVIFSSLEGYLSDYHQHERFLLGLGRRPLNVIIGAKKQSENSLGLLQPPEKTPAQSFQPPSPPLEPSTELESFAISKDLDTLAFLPASATVPKPGVNSELFGTGTYITQITDRIGYLYLESPDQPYIPGYRDRTIIAVDDKAIKLQLSSSQTPTDSTVSSYSRYSIADSLGHQDSMSSVATSTNSVPPWHHPTLNQQLNMTPYNYGYDLPCEFIVIGCTLSFHPSQFEAWIAHSASHFTGNLPPKAICTFCDDEDTSFESQYDMQLNWRNRMLHIGGHLQNFSPYEHMRPDYFVFDHMWANGLVSAEDYEHIMKYTEQPLCSGLVPLNHETPEMMLKKERNLRLIHDLAKEKRLMRNRKRKSNGKETQATSHKPGETKLTQIEEKKLENKRVEEQHGSDQAMPQTRGESKVTESNTAVDECQGDYDKESGNDGDKERELMLPTDNFERKIQSNLSSDDLDKPSIMPAKADRSSSKHSVASSRSRSTASSQSQTEAPSGTTELSSLSGSNSPNVGEAQIKQRQTLPDYSLLSDEIYFSDHISNSAPTSNPPHSRSIGASNPPSIPRRSYVDSLRYYSKKASFHSQESSLDSHTSYDSGSSVDSYGWLHSKFWGVPKEWKYRTPDNDCKYISSRSRGIVEVIDHRKAGYDPAEPRASKATFAHYEDTQRSYSRKYRPHRRR